MKMRRIYSNIEKQNEMTLCDGVMLSLHLLLNALREHHGIDLER